MKSTLPSPVLRTFGEPRFHTDGEVAALAYAADESLWSVEEPGVLRQWAADGRLLARHALSDLETLWGFGPDARWLASASDDLILWDVAAARTVLQLPQLSWVTAVAFHPTEPTIATGHDNGRVQIWGLPDGRPLAEYRPHPLPVSALAFSPDGRLLASAGEDRAIRVWNVAERRTVQTLTGHTDRIPALVWRPDGRVLVSAGWDTTARVWNIETGEPLILLNSHAAQVTALAYSPDGHLLACADSDQILHVWGDPTTGKRLHVLGGHSGDVRCLTFRRDGRRLASAGADAIIHVWDPHRGQRLNGSAGQGKHSIGLAEPPGGPARLASTASGAALQVWDVTTGKALPPTGLSALADGINAVALHSSGRYLAAGGQDTQLYLWDANPEKPPAILCGQTGPVVALAFAPSAPLLASACGKTGLIWIWDVQKGEPFLLIPEANDGCTVEALAWHPSGRLLACGGIDWLATGGTDGAACLWDIEARKQLMVWEGGVISLAFEPSGRRLAGGTLEGQITVWDAEAEAPVQQLEGHTDRVTAVAYSPDGARLASSGEDHTVRLWSPESGKQLAAYEMEGPVHALVFSADGRFLFTGNGNTTCSQLDMARLLGIRK